MSILPNRQPTGDEPGAARALARRRRRRAVPVRRVGRAVVWHRLAHGPATSDAVRARAADSARIVSTGRPRGGRAVAHARDLPVWAVRDRAAAVAWRAAHPERPDPEPAALPAAV